MPCHDFDPVKPIRSPGIGPGKSPVAGEGPGEGWVEVSPGKWRLVMGRAEGRTHTMPNIKKRIRRRMRRHGEFLEAQRRTSDMSFEEAMSQPDPWVGRERR